MISQSVFSCITCTGLCIAALAQSASASCPVTVSYDEPTFDRWNYQHNPTPGTRALGSIFSAIPDGRFDERSGTVILGFETDEEIDPGLGTSAYNITELAITIMVENDDTVYDPTADPWQSWLDSEDPNYIADTDADAWPIDLFGAAFRNGYALETYQGNEFFCSPTPLDVNACDCAGFDPMNCVETRSVYPIDFDAGGAPRDVSNNVRDEFDPNTFATGQIAGLTSGQLIPAGTPVTFNVNVSDPYIQAYLQDSLNRGKFMFVIASQHRTVEGGGGGGYPRFFMKESPFPAEPATLSMAVAINEGKVGDINGNGTVNVFDLLDLLLAWGPCDCCPADFDNSGSVNVFDLLELLLNWG